MIPAIPAWLAALAAGLSLAAPRATWAQQDDAEQEASHLIREEPDTIADHTPLLWSADLTLGIWQARPGGEFALAPNTDANKISIDDDLRLDNSESIFNAELTLRKGTDWVIRSSGFAVETTSAGSFGSAASVAFGGLTLDPGDAVTSRFEMLSVGVDIGKTLYRPLLDVPGNRNRFSRPMADLRIGPSVGLRVADIDTSITEIGVGTATASMTAAAIMLGINLELAYEPDQPIAGFIHSFAVEGFAAFGPAIGSSGVVSQVGVGISGMFSPNFGAMFGYRLLEFRVSDGPFDFDAGLQGLFLGGRISF